MWTSSREKVTPDHLAREAYLYVRQSTLKQVFENSESTQRQYALRERAMGLGWPPDHIHLIDADQGISGASSQDRLGFQRLVADVSLGKAGLVMGLEVSRLARNSADWHRLIEICALTRTLILDEDGIYDPKLFNDRLLLGLKGTMSEAELHILKDRLQGGLLNKAQRAELEIPLPTGFVYLPDGRVTLDPDAQVRASITEFFRLYALKESALATVRMFRTQGLLFPKRIRTGAHRGELHWDKLCHSQALRILHNPRYAGTYVFGRTHTEKLPTGKLRVTRPPQEKWDICIKDAHEGYINWDTFENNQRLLKEQSKLFRQTHRRPPREGPALIQGLVLCGQCGRRMTLRYHMRRGLPVPDYVCQSHSIEHGVKICQSINGVKIDEQLGRMILEKISRENIAITLSIEEELRASSEEIKRLHQLEVERARYESELAERRFFKVDPENRLVARTLEALWNEKLKALQEAQERFEELERRESQKEIAEETKASLCEVPRDLRAFWKSPTATNAEKKRIAHLVIEDVTLLQRDGSIRCQIRFRGGTQETVSVSPPPRSWVQQRTSDAVVEEISRLMADHTDSEIARILNRRGMTTGRGKRFQKFTVQRLEEKRGLMTRFQRLRNQGYLTQAELAARYQLSPGTIRTWYRKGLIKVHFYDERHRFLCEDPGKDKPIFAHQCWFSPRTKRLHNPARTK